MKHQSTFQVLIALLIISLQGLNAQPVYRALVNGQIVTKEGEVKEGRIEVQDYDQHAQHVIFFDELNIKRTYSASDLKSYSLDFLTKGEDGSFVKQRRHFQSKAVAHTNEPVYAFLEQEVEGNLNLYRYYMPSEDKKSPEYRIFVEGNKLGFSEIQKSNFIDEAKKVFGEYDEMSYALGMEGYEFNDMGRLVKNYNLWVSRR